MKWSDLDINTQELIKRGGYVHPYERLEDNVQNRSRLNAQNIHCIDAAWILDLVVDGLFVISERSVKLVDGSKLRLFEPSQTAKRMHNETYYTRGSF